MRAVQGHHAAVAARQHETHHWLAAEGRRLDRHGPILGLAASGLRPARFSLEISSADSLVRSRGEPMRRKLPPAAWILIAMVIGIIIGYMVFVNFPNKRTAAEIAGYI